jgi:hypothetical protein
VRQARPVVSRILLINAILLTLVACSILVTALASQPSAIAAPGCEVPEDVSGQPRDSGHDCRVALTSPTSVPTTTPVPAKSTPVPTSTPLPTSTPVPTKTAEAISIIETPSPTSTPTPTSTPLPTATPEPAQAAVVLRATATPQPTATPSPTPTAIAIRALAATVAPVAEVKAVVDQAPELNFLAEFPDLGDLSSNPGVIGANLSLALGSLLVLLAATTMFNATLKENAEWFVATAGRLPRPGLPLITLTGRLGELPSRLSQLSLVYPLALLALTAVIYSALDPHFGFNDSSLVLVLALMAGLTLTTFLYEGGQVLFSRRAFGMPAAIRAYPVAILIAAASVGLSRVVDLNPGVIFGFVAGAALTQRGIGRRELGIIVFIPMLGLLAVSLLALALISPLRSLAEGHSGAWATLPETIAVAVFVGGAESVLLALIPLTFTDGQKQMGMGPPGVAGAGATGDVSVLPRNRQPRRRFQFA